MPLLLMYAIERAAVAHAMVRHSVRLERVILLMELISRSQRQAMN